MEESMADLSWPMWTAFALMGVSLLLVFIRVVKGPGLPDRVVALDMVSYLAVGVIALWTLATGSSVYLDAALILALVGFLATVVFARYIEREPAR